MFTKESKKGSRFLVSQVETTKARIYLNQLAKHFSHKIQVDCDEDTAVFIFDIGSCKVMGSDESLTFYCDANNTKHLDEVAQVMQSHFERFSHKEALVMNWQ